ncbi:MAG: hypothetical protein IPH31_21955 [Lewinellaceae bacterium]|nr:hypothetical protein [Lewinellaceae bacterium]
MSTATRNKYISGLGEGGGAASGGGGADGLESDWQALKTAREITMAMDNDLIDFMVDLIGMKEYSATKPKSLWSDTSASKVGRIRLVDLICCCFVDGNLVDAGQIKESTTNQINE